MMKTMTSKIDIQKIALLSFTFAFFLFPMDGRSQEIPDFEIDVERSFAYEPGIQLTGPSFFLIETESVKGTESELAALREQVILKLKASGFKQANNEKSAYLQVGYWSSKYLRSNSYESNLKYYQATKHLIKDPSARKRIEANLEKYAAELRRMKKSEKEGPPKTQFGMAARVFEHGRRPKLLFSASLVSSENEKHDLSRLFESWLQPLEKLSAKDAPAKPAKDPGCFPSFGFEAKAKGEDDGFIISKIYPSSAAEKGGLKMNDELLEMEGFPYKAASLLGEKDYNEKFYGSKKPVKIKVKRAKKELVFNVIPAAICL